MSLERFRELFTEALPLPARAAATTAPGGFVMAELGRIAAAVADVTNHGGYRLECWTWTASASTSCWSLRHATTPASEPPGARGPCSPSSRSSCRPRSSSSPVMWRQAGADAAGVKALSDLVYFLFLPCLLFRSMATASFGGSDAKLLATYYGASLLWFLPWRCFSKLRKSAATPAAIVFALGAVFSNTVQLGIPIIKLAFGDDGLKMHLSIIAMHTLVLLTVGTIWLELSQAHAGDDAPPLSQTIGPVIKSAVLHPVILPLWPACCGAQRLLPCPAGSTSRWVSSLQPPAPSCWC